MPVIMPGISSSPLPRASFASRSDSETTPITWDAWSSTGNALTRCSRRAAAMTSNDVSLPTVGDELGGVELPGGDRDAPGPLLFQVQHGRAAVHADVRDPAARPGQPHRHLERGRGADRLDRHVRAAPPGQGLDHGHRVFALVVDDDVGAEVTRGFQTGV